MKLRIFAPLLLLISLSVGLPAGAGTFVGNGGSEGDVELAVSLMQVKETFSVIHKLDGQDSNICTCNSVYSRSPLCEPLRSLGDEQARYCTKVLYTQAPQILRLVKSRDNLRIRWTHEPIDVIENGDHRAADAAADRSKNQITINLPAFRRMGPAERVFLLTHELMHLTEFEGRPMSDAGSVGVFRGEQGGRNLINAMAASASVLQGEYPKEIKSYKAKRHRSQAWKHFWIDMDGGSSQYNGQQETTFGFNRYKLFSMTARYQLTHWGVFAGFRSLNESKKIKGTISAEEKVKILTAGVSYRIFFADDPLTFWGQTNLVIQAGVERVQADYKSSEYVSGANVTIGDSESAKSLGGSFGATYYIPIFWGLWGNLGGSLDYHPYKLDNFNINNDQSMLTVFGGLSYAF
jgi:hypothetical protein